MEKVLYYLKAWPPHRRVCLIVLYHMESQPQNPEFRNNPENFHPCMFRLINTCTTLNPFHSHGLSIRPKKKISVFEATGLKI